MTHAWPSVRVELRRLVGDETFEIWLAPLEAADWDGTTLTLVAPPGTQAWVADRYRRVILRAVQGVFGHHAKLSFAAPAPSTRPAAPPGRRSGRSAPVTTVPAPSSLETFIPRYSFDQFIIGDGNRLAHAAALAVAEAPGQAYNPLFLYAPPGLGKTHLLHAIGNYIAAYDSATTVRYTTVEAFTNQFVSATQHRNDLGAFKQLYRDADVLLIDDVQFLAQKAKTAEEFFHTFNSLYDSGRQLVLTADCLPAQLTGIEERLLARFESGLVAELAPPNRATRIAILRKRAALDRIALPDPTVLELIADRVSDNVRALEGALIRVIAHGSLTGRPIDTELAAAVLGPARGTPAPPAATITVARVQELVAGHFGLTREDLISGRRTAKLTWPRHLAIFLARELTGASLTALGDAFGGRNHTTILHGCNRVTEQVARSVEAEAELEALRRLLTAGETDRDA